MTCREFWDLMPELEAAEQSPEHVRECPRCATRLEQQRALAVGLRRVAGQRHSLQAPARLEERLLAAFRGPTVPLGPPATLNPPAAHLWFRWPAQLAVAAAVMLLGVLLLGKHPQKPAQPVAAAETAVAADVDSDFIPLPYAGEAAPAEDANLIRVEMPRSALVALGVPVAESDSGEPVEAEVLLGQGGAPEAVRLLQ